MAPAIANRYVFSARLKALSNRSSDRVRQLRSADTRTLIVSRTRSSFGDGTFGAAGPQVWNSLLSNLRLCGLSYGQFRRLRHVYSDSEATIQCELFLTAPSRNILTYLLGG